jgi:predicted nucleic acid-binding protein
LSKDFILDSSAVIALLMNEAGADVVDSVIERAEAGRLKATYKISMADALLLAHGIENNATIITSDHHELDIVEQSENIDFLWFR